MISPVDLQKILNRTQERQEQILFLGLGDDDSWENWKWEDKYNLKFSVPIHCNELSAAYQKGVLRKGQLKDGSYYWGICRNARVAKWSCTCQAFLYQHLEGTYNTKEIKHPEDEEGADIFGDGRLVAWDTFIPWVEVIPLPCEVVP